jgi:hypothetical protein
MIFKNKNVLPFIKELYILGTISSALHLIIYSILTPIPEVQYYYFLPCTDNGRFMKYRNVKYIISKEHRIGEWLSRNSHLGSLPLVTVLLHMNTKEHKDE